VSHMATEVTRCFFLEAIFLGHFLSFYLFS
jgi:hypothetical protein